MAKTATKTTTRALTFAQATAMYVHRFTMDHVPNWTRTPHKGKYYAPQFASDQEWYKATKFPGEPGHHGIGSDCYTTGQTWPLGQWLDVPYERRR